MALGSADGMMQQVLSCKQEPVGERRLTEGVGHNLVDEHDDDRCDQPAILGQQAIHIVCTTTSKLYQPPNKSLTEGSVPSRAQLLQRRCQATVAPRRGSGRTVLQRHK